MTLPFIGIPKGLSNDWEYSKDMRDRIIRDTARAHSRWGWFERAGVLDKERGAGLGTLS